MRETAATQPTANNGDAPDFQKKENMKITALYADVIIGINPGSLENTGVPLI